MVKVDVGKAWMLGVAVACSAAASAQDVASPSDGPASQDAATGAVPEPAVATIPVDGVTTPSADAQGTDAGGANRGFGNGIEEVVVTAQKREESINSVPIAINAFTGEDLEQLGVTDTRDLSKLVPGFTASESGFNTPVYTLRGVGFTDPSQTSSATVGIYTDEFNLPYPTMSRGANVDLQRVEVLKGPQGTLYGRNTTAGLVNYISNKPTDTFETGLTGSYGKYESAEAEGFVSGGLTDTLDGRVAATARYAGEGWQYSRTRSPDGPYDRLGRQRKGALRGLLDWKPMDDLKLEFSASGWLDHGEPQAPQAIAIVAQNPFVGALALDTEVANYPVNSFNTHNNRVADWPDQFRYSDEKVDFRLHDRFWSPTLRTDWAVTDTTTVTLLADYQKYESNGSFLPQSGLNTVNSERALYTDIASQSVELRAAGRWGDLAQWQIGGNLAHDKVDDVQDFRQETTSAVFPDPIDLTNPALNLPPAISQILLSLINGTPVFPLVAERSGFDGHQVVDTYAVFGNVDWTLTDTLKLTSGLRYTSENRKFAGCATSSDQTTQGVGLQTLFNAVSLAMGGTGGAVAGGCVTLDSTTHNPQRFHGKLDEDNVGWRLALSWQPTDGALYYVSQSRGFKSGSFPSINISQSNQFAPVTQERLDAWEIGTKLTLFDHRLHVNASGFYYDYKDKQLLDTTVDPIFGPLPILANAPKSKVVGAETDLEWAPLDGLLLSTAATYLHTEVIRFTGRNPDGDVTDYAGHRFNFTPRFTVTGLVNYSHPLTDRYGYTLGADLTHVTGANATLAGDPLYAIMPYTVVNARAGVETLDGRWKLSVWGRNVFDEYYYNNVIRATDSVSRFTGMPVTYGVTVSWLMD